MIQPSPFVSIIYGPGCDQPWKHLFRERFLQMKWYHAFTASAEVHNVFEDELQGWWNHQQLVLIRVAHVLEIFAR